MHELNRSKCKKQHVFIRPSNHRELCKNELELKVAAEMRALTLLRFSAGDGGLLFPGLRPFLLYVSDLVQPRQCVPSPTPFQHTEHLLSRRWVVGPGLAKLLWLNGSSAEILELM